MKIVLASKSRQKTGAVNHVIETLGLKEATFEEMATDSRVPIQPEGDDVRRGAKNRASAARAKMPEAYAIGIESGLRRTPRGTADYAAVLIMAPDGTETWAESAEIIFPEWAVEEARKQGFDKTTVGRVLFEKRRTGAADNPHFWFCGRSRWEIVAAAVQQALCEAIGKHEGWYPISIAIERSLNPVRRRLPVRQVAPGVSVALFDPLGDWQLCEAAGKRLAELIPYGTEALIMPDGKAQALLHVIGRESRLPTFVARKEQKPYMARPTLSVSVKSITTAREQRLFIGRDAAEALRGKKVAIVDDVVSTGGTLAAMRELIKAAGGEANGAMAAFVEGELRNDVISLGRLPLFKD